jgi:hypothetical protein
MKTLIVSSLLVFSSISHSKVFKVAKITSEFDKNVTDFYVETNEENVIDSIRYVTKNPNGGISEDVSVPAEIVMEEGSVISQHNGYEAVRLEVEDFSFKTGGTIRLNYLFNGISGARHIKRLILKNTEEKSELVDPEGRPVNRMFFHVNRSPIFGVIGVKSIMTSYAEDISHRR